MVNYKSYGTQILIQDIITKVAYLSNDEMDLDLQYVKLNHILKCLTMQPYNHWKPPNKTWSSLLVAIKQLVADLNDLKSIKNSGVPYHTKQSKISIRGS